MTKNEILTLLITALVLIIAYLTYRKTFNNKGELRLLKEQFIQTQNLSLKIQDYMETLIDAGYGDHLYIKEGNVTFNQGLEVTKEYYDLNLSDLQYQTFNSQLSKAQIAHYSKGFETQYKSLQEIEIALKIVIGQLGLV
jgi:hypothetical protein